MTWIITLISVTGSILNAKHSVYCFYIWIMSNILWIMYDLYIKLYSRALLDIFQTIICIYGIINWRKMK